jgi:hypothetical protein
MIVPRSHAKEGYKDINNEDHTDEDGHGGYLKQIQGSSNFLREGTRKLSPNRALMLTAAANQLIIIEDKWTDDYKVRVYKD